MNTPKFSLRPHKDPSQDSKDSALSENTIWRTKAGTAVFVLGLTITATMGYTAITSKLDAGAKQMDGFAAKESETQERVKALERAQADLASMKTDVEWIKRTLQEDRRKE